MKAKIALSICIILTLCTASYTAAQSIDQTTEIYNGNPLIYTKQMDWPIIIGCFFAILVLCAAWHFIKEFEKYDKQKNNDTVL